MNVKAKAWALVVGFAAVAFAAGWLITQVQNVAKLDPGEVVANRWVTGTGLLVRNAIDLRPVDPKTTQLVIRSGLDGDSVVLAQFYDGMPPALKKRVAFHIPGSACDCDCSKRNRLSRRQA